MLIRPLRRKRPTRPAFAPPSPGGGLLFSDLRKVLESYLGRREVADIYRAYLFGEQVHAGQTRRSGEPYISHPLEVARLLAEMHLDAKGIMAALLHDVIEDTPTAKDQIAKSFGEEVAQLVDGVSKLTQIQFQSQAEAQAENFRKMLMAMAHDIRVILIKLADRLHNMRTLGAMPPEKRRRIARETLEIYAPIANRLGMNRLRLELEDLGFAWLYPMRCRILAEAVKRARGNRKEFVHTVETSINRRLRQEGLGGRVIGREKHLYGIYLKMHNKHLSFSEVFDVYAFRIIVDKVDTSYRVLGVVHNLYKPVPGRFKDYIAIPKANGYQSLHTTLFSPYGVPIEVQIRTDDMDRFAEAGIAAHWLYKSGDHTGSAAHARALDWLRGLLELQRSAGNSLEFLEHVKIDLFPDEVYVFTPKGKILELPRGATAVDFAYAVHTDVGNTCVAVKINRHLMPLRTPLLNGQTVEIMTASGARPNPAWLNFVVTGKARANIRHYLKNLQRQEAVELGRRLLDKALDAFALSINTLPPARVAGLLEEFHLKSLDDLLDDIGLGNRMAPIVARQLAPALEEAAAGAPAGSFRARPLSIKGNEGMVVSLAKCCRPIPGDPILGFVSAGRGIVIHVQSCKNVAEFRHRPEKWVEVQWDAESDGEFPVEVRVDVTNQRGVLATVAAAIAEMGSNIENVGMEERDGMTSTLMFTITARDRRHLARIMRRVRAIKLVMRIARVRG